MSARPHQDIDRGWAWVAVISVYLSTIINCIAVFMGGVIHVALLNKFKEGDGKTSLVGALSSGILCMFSPVCGILINKFSSRTSLLAGGIITSTGFAGCAFVDSLDGIILGAGVVVGIGYALTASGNVVNIGYYFDKRRNLMISINFVLVGVGMFCSAPLGLLIIDSFGLSSLFLILAGIYAHTCVLGMFCKPSSLERKVQEERRTRVNVPKDGNSLCHLFKFSLICNKPFLCFLISSCTWNFALISTTIHLPNYIKLKGGSDIEVGWVMTAFAISNILGRVGGTISVSKEYINALTVHTVSVGLCGVTMTCFPLYSGYNVGKYLLSIFLGLLCGCPNSLVTVLSIRFVGREMLSEAHGFSYLFCGIGVSAGPVITGYLLGLTGSYNHGFVLAGTIFETMCMKGTIQMQANNRSGLVLIMGSFFGLLASIMSRHVEGQKKRETAELGLDKS